MTVLTLGTPDHYAGGLSLHLENAVAAKHQREKASEQIGNATDYPEPGGVTLANFTSM